MSRVQKRIEKERETLEESKKELEGLKSDLSYAETEDYQVKLSRDRLGLARSGEAVIIMPDAETIKKFSSRVEIAREFNPPEPNWRRWINLFF